MFIVSLMTPSQGTQVVCCTSALNSPASCVCIENLSRKYEGGCNHECGRRSYVKTAYTCSVLV